MNEQVNIERVKLKDLLIDIHVSKRRQDAMDAIIDNIAWMKVKLDETREMIKSSSVAIPYDNGGGQTGIRENPLFKGYESLFKSYMSGMDQILALLPPEEAMPVETADKPKTVLELVRDKHKKEA
ncbi:MAG: hypothetical protein ACOX6E_08615 [Syntrophomonadaceae bacterium]|jgi:hypothetical protein